MFLKMFLDEAPAGHLPAREEVENSQEGSKRSGSPQVHGCQPRLTLFLNFLGQPLPSIPLDFYLPLC